MLVANLLAANDYNDTIIKKFLPKRLSINKEPGMTKKLAVAYYNLSIMLNAGIPMLKALDTTVAGLKGNLKKAFSALAKGASAGDSLAETMRKHPWIFAPIDVMLVEVAETSGNLPKSFKQLSQWYEFRNRLKHTIISGLILPLTIILIAAFIIPLPRLVLGQLSFFKYFIHVSGTLAIFCVPAVIIVAILRLMPNTGLSRRVFDDFVLRVPGLGQAVRKLALSRYCRTFNLLYQAGIPIAKCAQKASESTGNCFMTDLLKGGAESAQAGKMVYEGFSPKLPADFLNLWQVGEETGELDKTVERIANNTSETAEWLLTEFCRWLVRLIYFLICAFLAIQVLMMGLSVYGGGYGTFM
jgi:type IV pilus assembly protein PilC